MYGRSRLWAARLGMAPWWGVIATPDDRRHALEGRQSYGIGGDPWGTAASSSTSLSPTRRLRAEVSQRVPISTY